MDEMLKLLRCMSSEIREMRSEIEKLRSEMHEKKVGSSWMDMRDVCEYLHISQSTMKNRMNAGEFAFAIKKGRKWMFSADKIRKYANMV